MKTFAQLCKAVSFPNNYKDLGRQYHTYEENTGLSAPLAFKAYSFLFPEKSLSMGILIHKLASELQHDPQVISDMVQNSETELIKALASESQGEDRIPIEEAFNLRHRIVEEGRLDFVDTASRMGMMEAQVFWHSVLDTRPRIITEWQFMRHLGKPTPEHDGKSYELQLRNAMSIYDPAEVMEKIFYDTYSLRDTQWWQLDKVQLQPKRFLSWGTDDALLSKAYNDGFMQLIPRYRDVKWKELTVTLHGREHKVWLEMVIDGKNTILDAVWPHAPKMGLSERLMNADNMSPWFPIQKPERMPRWNEVVEKMDDFHIRIPHMGEYDPYKKAGYMIVKDKQTMCLRLKSVIPVGDSDFYLEVEARDGIDYEYVGNVLINQLDDKTALFSKLRMVIGPHWGIQKQNWHVPEEYCIVVRVSSPYLDSGSLVTPVFVGFDDGAGASDVIQIVDMMAAPKENLLDMLEES